MGTRQHETRDRRSAGLQKLGELAVQVVCRASGERVALPTPRFSTHALRTG